MCSSAWSGLPGPARRARRPCSTTPRLVGRGRPSRGQSWLRRRAAGRRRRPATVTLVAGLLDELGVSRPAAATCLYAGLSADTCSFGFGNTRPDTTSSRPACSRPASTIPRSAGGCSTSRRSAGWACCRRSPAAPAPGAWVGNGGLGWTWSSTAEAAEYGRPGEQLEALVDVVRATAGGGRRLRPQGSGRRLLVGVAALAGGHGPPRGGDDARRGRAHPGGGYSSLAGP